MDTEDINISGEALDPNSSAAVRLFGTLEVEGMGIYYVFVSQSSTRRVWMLTERSIFQSENPKADVVSIVRVDNTGCMSGQGKTYLLTRLLDSINVMMGRCVQKGENTVGFLNKGEFTDEATHAFIRYESSFNGKRYITLEMSYEGFRLSLSKYSKNFPVPVPRTMTPVMDEKTQAAVIAGLGVFTFAILKKRMGSKLDWYNKKKYILVDSNEKFRAMMLEFLNDVQEANREGTSILTTIDTETTGLNVLDLAPENPFRDHIVAIPFGWRNDEAYLICTDMYYFGNVDADEVYPLFNTLFSRNQDFSFQDIELDYAGQHFSFNRKNILLVGVNCGFDECAFFSEGVNMFFDEDIQIMHYNLATDWVQGKNGLKAMTRRYIGDETLELEDLFGPQHKDKFRYLTDPELALVYGGADADYPRPLWRKLRRLTSDNLYYMYRKYDMTARYLTAQATWRGMWVDTSSVKIQGEKVQQDLNTLKDFIYKYAYAANRNNLDAKADKLRELLGLETVSEVSSAGEQDGMYRYPFTPANHKHLLFNILGYPVVKMSEKSQTPALDKFVLKKLAERKRDTPVNFLLEDIPSVADPSEPLIKKDEFNQELYPLARVFLTYAKINKEYTAYYKPILQNDLEGRMFYNFSLQKAATRRILSPGQTMKGSLKRLVIAPPGNLFFCFDASQIEYRHMASLAYIQTKNILKRQYPNDWEQRLSETGIARIHRMMQGKEADYHIETASMMTGQPQYMIDHSTRKMYKSIGFGIPYGLGDRSMCEALFGRVNKETLAKTRKVLDDYKARQFEIIRLLETVRDSAFVPAPIPDEFRDMLGVGDTHVGIVRNFVGFYRLFILEKLTRARTSRIRRQAGNCIIQGGAAELFRRMLYNFYLGCVEAGIADQLRLEMLVHDEVDSVVSSSVDVCKLLSVTNTACTLQYTDHIPYYIGIGVGLDWHSAKDDAAELPVIMVERLSKAYNDGKFSIPSDGQQAENLLKLKRHYLCDRVGEELHALIPELGPGFVWSDRAVEHVEENFTNYIVRAYLPSFLTKEDKEKYKKQVPMRVLLERWQEAREEYGFGRDFLTEKFVDARQMVQELVLGEESADSLDLSVEDDLSSMRIDLLENTAEEELLQQAQGDSGWFSETALFDSNIPQEEILADSDDDKYTFLSDKDAEEDELVLNENPTSAYDVFVTKHYVRKKVLSVTEGGDKFSVLLDGTPYQQNVNSLAREVKNLFGTGTGSIVFIGSTINRLSQIDCSADKLDALDRFLCGKTDKIQIAADLKEGV